VEALPCNRSCRGRAAYPLREEWQGLTFRRVWRPDFKQSSGAGRLLNAAWMILSWCRLGFRSRGRLPDAVLVGTDPVLSVLTFSILRRLRPSLVLAHWAFDLYPEAPIADGMVREDSGSVRLLRRLLRGAYGACDLVADLGPCMRRRLEAYGHQGEKTTIVPWALYEPEAALEVDPKVRRQLFGDCRLGLLYSGNYGRAHACREFLLLARELREDGIRFCFSVRGNRESELRAAVQPEDGNVSFAEFATESELGARLSAADIHLVSLQDEWTGVVVPSKFFGCLAAGRPVLYRGRPDSGIGRWIAEHGVGWMLTESSVPQIAGELRRLAADPSALRLLQRRCFEVYQRHFSRRRSAEAWDRGLRAALGRRSAAGETGIDARIAPPRRTGGIPADPARTARHSVA